jgi:O-antigen/teichoic acid export membrane protein
MRILCVGYLLNLVAEPLSPVVQGMGRPEYQRNAQILGLLLNVALSSLLVNQYGLYGAPVGTSIALAVASWYYLSSFHRLLDRSLLRFLRDTVLKPAVSAVVSGAAGIGVTSVLLGHAPAGRVTSLLVTVAGGATFVLLYWLLILRWGVVDRSDAALLRNHVPFLRQRPS